MKSYLAKAPGILLPGLLLRSSLLIPVLFLFSASAQTQSTPWWSSGWSYRAGITVQNSSASTSLPTRYSVTAALDSSQLVAGGLLLSSCADLRVVYFDGTTDFELDRVVNGCGTPQTEVWFALQRPIPASAQDAGYYLYYGNTAAGAPPSNGMNVFLFYESWENGSTHWRNAGGLDSSATGTMGSSTTSTDDAVSPTHSQKFSRKAMGGDAFSGYIPVTPNTLYALTVSAKSATATYFPVGFDPYSSSLTRGSEVWLWTSEWSVSSQWTQRTATFTTNSTTAYLKLKSEWWTEAPGTAPLYSDNLALRYGSSIEPSLSLGTQQSSH